MRYTWDTAKQASNIEKHGVDFAAIEGFEWPSAVVRADTRANDPETRLFAIGSIGDRLHALVYTVERRSVRIISLRKASQKEQDRYVKEAEAPDQG